MDSVIDNLDAWQCILGELQAVTCGLSAKSPMLHATRCGAKELSITARPPRSSDNVSRTHSASNASVRIVELSERSLTIVWHDPTSCSYVDQRWTRSKSGRVGICALSGEDIRKGVDIFKPCGSKPPPANAGAMILVTALRLPLNDSEVLQ